MVVITDSSNVGGGGPIFQWQRLSLEQREALEDVHEKRTTGITKEGSFIHDYDLNEWHLVPIGHWNWKWNSARSNYSTYEQELLSGILLLSSQSRVIGTCPIVWFCDQQPTQSNKNGVLLHRLLSASSLVYKDGGHGVRSRSQHGGTNYIQSHMVNFIVK